MFRLDNSVLLERFVAVEGNHSNFYSLIFNALLCWHWRRIDRERRVSKASPEQPEEVLGKNKVLAAEE